MAKGVKGWVLLSKLNPSYHSTYIWRTKTWTSPLEFAISQFRNSKNQLPMKLGEMIGWNFSQADTAFMCIMQTRMPLIPFFLFFKIHFSHGIHAMFGSADANRIIVCQKNNCVQKSFAISQIWQKSWQRWNRVKWLSEILSGYQILSVSSTDVYCFVLS